MAPNRNYNRFGELYYDIECYRCQNFGHIARNYRSRIIGPQDLFKENKQPTKYQTNWKGKQKYLKNGECRLALTAQNSKRHWCVDSGCSRNMTGNRNTFHTLQEKVRIVTFSNNNSSKILGKGTIRLGKKDATTKNVLLRKYEAQST